jgi:hypothetical protein
VRRLCFSVASSTREVTVYEINPEHPSATTTIATHVAVILARKLENIVILFFVQTSF